MSAPNHSFQDTPRQAKARAAMDGAKAFEAASSMEEPLADLRRVARTLHLLFAEAAGADADVGDALYLLANTAQDCIERAQALRSNIFHVTWGYKHPARPPNNEPWEAGLIAQMEETLRTQKAARRKLDKATARR